jgi:hypothetical protein
MPPREPAEPPRTVKSPPVTMTFRPSILASPSTDGFGVKPTSSSPL